MGSGLPADFHLIDPLIKREGENPLYPALSNRYEHDEKRIR